jgi:hypothetical protein
LGFTVYGGGTVLSINCQTVEIFNKKRFQWGPWAHLVRLLALFVLSLPGGVGYGMVWSPKRMEISNPPPPGRKKKIKKKKSI